MKRRAPPGFETVEHASGGPKTVEQVIIIIIITIIMIVTTDNIPTIIINYHDYHHHHQGGRRAPPGFETVEHASGGPKTVEQGSGAQQSIPAAPATGPADRWHALAGYYVVFIVTVLSLWFYHTVITLTLHGWNTVNLSSLCCCQRASYRRGSLPRDKAGEWEA
jgi:hypothetical protein